MANATSRSSTMISLKQSGSIGLSIDRGYNYSGLGVVNPFVHNSTVNNKALTLFPLDMLVNPLWQLYKNLYDEFRIVRCGLKITGLSTIGAGGQMGGCKLITYWDRSNKQRDFYAGNLIDITRMINMPGARSHSFTNNTQVKAWTAVRASDLVEKITYTDVDVQGWTLTSAQSGMAHDQNGSCTATFANSGTSAFNPCCYFCIYSPIQNNTDNAWPVNLMLDLYCTIELRNPKYTSQAASAALSVAKGETPSELPTVSFAVPDPIIPTDSSTIEKEMEEMEKMEAGGS